MTLKVLAGFAAALAVTTVGVFAANGGSVSSMLGSSESSCGTKSSCPLSAMMSCCSESEAALDTQPISTVNPDALGAFAGGVTAAAPTAPTEEAGCCPLSKAATCTAESK